MKRDKQNSRENPGYSGRIDVDALFTLEQMNLHNTALDNQRTAIMVDRFGMAAKSVAGAGYEVLVKAPARAIYGLASLGVQAGVGLAGVVANTALGLIPAIAAAYAAVDSINRKEDPIQEQANRVDEYVKNMTDFLKGSHGPTINV
jgi:hypothetical protein